MIFSIRWVIHKNDTDNQPIEYVYRTLIVVYIVQVFKIPQQMGRTYSVVEEVDGEVCAVAVGDSDNVFQ